MDLPLDIWAIVGQYAVASLFDLSTLSRAGLRETLDHPGTLADLQLEFQGPEDVFGCQILTDKLLSGVRSLKFETSGNGVELTRLVPKVPRLRELDLERTTLNTTDFLAGWRDLRSLRMTNCAKCSPFVGSLQTLHLRACSPVSGNLADLQTLKLHGCFMTGITHMSSTLRSLDLRNTRWGSTGWTLDHLCELTSLRELTLFRCETLENTNAAGIGRMKDLHTLVLVECFNVTDFSFLAELPKLRSLTVPFFSKFSVLPRLNLESLTFLSVSIVNVDDLSLVGSQTNLKFLSATCYSHKHTFFDPHPMLHELLPKLPSLHTLDLSNWAALQFFPPCPSVRQLVVDNCKAIRDNELFMLGVSFPNLEALGAANTDITDIGLGALQSHLPRLKHLDISQCTISEEGLKSLKGLTLLQSLNISNCGVMPVFAPETVKLLGMRNFSLLDRASQANLKARGVEVVGDRTFRARFSFGLGPVTCTMKKG